MTERALAIGVGCNSGVSAADIVALIREALSQTEAATENAPFHLYTMEEKREVAALRQAATELNMPLTYLPLEALKARSPHTVTHSPAVHALYGVPSVAETAALAGAGPGSSLVLPRIAAHGVTCAIATSGPMLSPTS